ncbi:MAG: hypothetical protein DRJ26_01400 [Candidatus Methanomethylicota archaeon]|uniref:Major facilitator superfamily (MFS) profile domain-containing protein n=1 Tax=Thermoproteota archaeon TaxID=2056631 RepID=A0A497F672_9CREN|nr:MAG: hypothetical protein DRJ26_01400 [Candidatus Verstraetearchaeota archaeon]
MVLLCMGFAGWTLSYILRMMLPPIFPLIIEELGLSGFEAGMLMSAFFSTYALMQLPAGFLTDKLSRKSMISICIALSSAAALFSALASDYGQLILARALFGLAAGLYYSPMISMISDAFEPKHRGRAIGFFMSGSRLGSALAPILAVHIAISYGWRMAFIACALPGFILALIFYLLVSEPMRDEVKSMCSLALIKANWRPLFIAYILPAVSMMASMGLATFLPMYFITCKELSIESAALIVSLSFLAGFAGHIFGGFLTDKLGCKYAMLSTLILTLVSILLLHTISGSAIVFPAIFFGFISVSGAAPTIAYTVESSPEGVRGFSLGIGNTTGFIGASVGSAVGGLIIDLLGYDQLLTFIFTIYALALLITMFIPNK